MIATLYALTIALTGGFTIEIAGIRVRSRSWVRPALVALAGVAVLVLLLRERLPAISARVSRVLESSGVATWPTWLTVAATAWALAAGVGFGTFASGGADSYGYVAQARLLAHGHLTDTIPSSADYVWPDVEATLTPLGFRPGRTRGVIAPIYPPGFPLLLAPLAACSERLIYLLVPVFGALLVWITYRMGATLGDPPAGAMAAALLSVSPTFLYQVVQPMSDVPAAACWLGALLLAVRGTAYAAAGSGAICSLAILIRPNLAPLAGLIATAAIFSSSAFRLRRAFLFAGALVPGLVTLGSDPGRPLRIASGVWIRRVVGQILDPAHRAESRALSTLAHGNPHVVHLAFGWGSFLGRAARAQAASRLVGRRARARDMGVVSALRLLSSERVVLLAISADRDRGDVVVRERCRALAGAAASRGLARPSGAAARRRPRRDAGPHRADAWRLQTSGARNGSIRLPGPSFATGSPRPHSCWPGSTAEASAITRTVRRCGGICCRRRGSTRSSRHFARKATSRSWSLTHGEYRGLPREIRPNQSTCDSRAHTTRRAGGRARVWLSVRSLMPRSNDVHCHATSHQRSNRRNGRKGSLFFQKELLPFLPFFLLFELKGRMQRDSECRRSQCPHHPAAARRFNSRIVRSSTNRDAFACASTAFRPERQFRPAPHSRSDRRRARGRLLRTVVRLDSRPR